MHGCVLVLVARPSDQLVPLAVEIAVGEVKKDIRFIFIIVIERPLGHAGRRGDLGQRDIGKRLRVQQAGRGVEDLLLDIVVARRGHVLSSFLILCEIHWVLLYAILGDLSSLTGKFQQI